MRIGGRPGYGTDTAGRQDAMIDKEKQDKKLKETRTRRENKTNAHLN